LLLWHLFFAGLSKKKLFCFQNGSQNDVLSSRHIVIYLTHSEGHSEPSESVSGVFLKAVVQKKSLLPTKGQQGVKSSMLP